MDGQSKVNPKMLAIAVLILALIAGGIWYWRTRKTAPPEKKGAVRTVEKVSESVPKITNNPAEKVPEVNPLDRANPFKYTNPLR